MIQSTTATTHPPSSDFDAESHRRRLSKIIRKKSFCTLATTSPAGRAHSAGVVYDVADGNLWVHAERTSRKVRSISENPNVGVCIPFRRLPAGPPYTIHFQARATVVEMDDLEVRELLATGALAKISGHGALEMPEGCFVKVQPNHTVHSFGPGARPLDLIRDPLNAGARTVRFDGAVA
ncbi:MAG: pyridoxamine 5'-phosphate oxidase family protein [Acidimicrobiales bacterium]